MSQPKKVDIRSTIIRQKFAKHQDKMANDSENKAENVAQVLAWIDTAKALGDIDLNIMLLGNLGNFYLSQGESDKALETYRTIEQLIQQSGGSPIYLIKTKMNMATIQVGDSTQIEQGIEQYQQVILLTEDIPDVEALEIKLHCHCNLASVYLLIYQYDNVRSATESFWTEWENPYLSRIKPDLRTGLVGLIRRAEAMLHIINGEYEQADNKIRLLLELAKTQNNHNYIVTSYMLQAMLALESPNHPTSAEDYWKQADEFVDGLLEQQGTSLYYIARHSYAENAGQFAYLGHNDWADRCREMAKQLYSKSGQVDISL